METDNERMIQSQLKNCSFQIEGLEACVKHAPQELGKQCEELISELVAYQEALKRDLLKVTDENKFRSSGRAA
jgi:hypothetical protein